MSIEEHPKAAWAHGVRSKVTRDVAVVLVDEATTRAVVVLTVNAYGVVDRDAHEIVQDRAQRSRIDSDVAPIACREGCNFCCHYRISVLPMEAISVAKFVQDRFSADERSALVDRVKKYNETLNVLPAAQRLSRPLPCPFLVSGKCSVYGMRPIACRMHHSTDVDACEKSLENPDYPVPVPSDFRHAATPVLAGLNKGAKMALKKSYDLEYIRAIELLLEDPSVADRWLAGEDAFASAEDVEVRELVKAKSGGQAAV